MIRPRGGLTLERRQQRRGRTRGTRPGRTPRPTIPKRFLSLLTFSWIDPLLRAGYLQPLNLDTVPALDWEDGALRACGSFLHAWNSVQGKKYSLSSNIVVLTLAKCYTKEMILVGVYAFLRTLAVVSLPVLLYTFVKYSNSEKNDVALGVFLVGCLLVVKLVESLSQRHWFFDSRRFGMRMRSSSGRRKHSRGEIVNYIAVDAYRLGEFPWWFHMAWSLPLQLYLFLPLPLPLPLVPCHFPSCALLVLYSCQPVCCVFGLAGAAALPTHCHKNARGRAGVWGLYSPALPFRRQPRQLANRVAC